MEAMLKTMEAYKLSQAGLENISEEVLKSFTTDLDHNKGREENFIFSDLEHNNSDFSHLFINDNDVDEEDDDYESDDYCD